MARLPQQPSHRVAGRGRGGAVAAVALRQALAQPGLGAGGDPGAEGRQEAVVQTPQALVNEIWMKNGLR